MILTIINQVAGIRSYLGGLVTVSDSGQTTISRDLNVVIAGDAQLLSDVFSTSVILNNGVKNLNPGEGKLLCETLAAFSTDPLATLLLYYTLPVEVRQSTTTAAGSTVWAFRNPLASPYMFVVDSINLTHSFHKATPILGASVLLTYELLRFNTATPTGGTSIIPIKGSSLAPASALDARFLDTGLSMTNVVFDTSITVLSVPSVIGSVAVYGRNGPALKFAPGEGLAIRLKTENAIVGQAITGDIVGSLR